MWHFIASITSHQLQVQHLVLLKVEYIEYNFVKDTLI
jgi:hypothetical protein